MYQGEFTVILIRIQVDKLHNFKKISEKFHLNKFKVTTKNSRTLITQTLNVMSCTLFIS